MATGGTSALGRARIKVCEPLVQAFTPTALKGLALAELASDAAESEKSVKNPKTRRDLGAEGAMGEAKVPSCPGRRKGIKGEVFFFRLGSLGPWSRAAQKRSSATAKENDIGKSRRFWRRSERRTSQFSNRIAPILAWAPKEAKSRSRRRNCFAGRLGSSLDELI